MVDVGGKARYQRGHSDGREERHTAHYCRFKLATSTFVLSMLDNDFYSNIPQALRFYYIHQLSGLFLSYCANTL